MDAQIPNSRKSSGFNRSQQGPSKENLEGGCSLGDTDTQLPLTWIRNQIGKNITDVLFYEPAPLLPAG